jgi:glycosyltransferase involved in cell wall biosynthesis
VSRVLVVTETSRSHGEFRRPWVRSLYGAHVRRYRRAVAATLARLAPAHEVTLVAGRDLVDRATLPAGVRLRLYDEESFKTEAEPLADLGARLVAAWWPRRDAEPALSVNGVWLPDLLPVAKGILLRLEVFESLAALERVMDEVKPQRLVLMTGASTAERLARAFAEDRAIAVSAAAWIPSALALAALGRTLRVREDWQALRQLLHQARRSPPLPEGRPRIVFTACQTRHFEVVEPLAVSLHRAGVGATVLAASVDGAMDARLVRVGAAGVPCAYFMDYLPRAEARRVVRELRPLRRRLLHCLDADPAYDTLSRHGSVRLGRILRPFAVDALSRSVVIARLYLEGALRALDALGPDAVVIASDRRYAERALALAARARGIPILLFWGASLLSRDRTNTFDVADRLLLIGNDVRAALVAQGLEPRRLTVVGDPRSNAARLEPRTGLRERVFADFALAPGRPLLVLVSKYVSVLFSSEEKEAFYRTVALAVERLGRPHVVIKVHPNEHLPLLREQVRGWGWRDAVLTQSYDIHRLFRAADVAVMVTSMAGVEAMAMECPVVALQTRGKDFEGDYMPPYVSEGAVARVDMDDAEGLAAALASLVSDAAAREALVARGRAFAARYLHPVDGRLTERLVGVVAEVGAEVAALRAERAAAGRA